jgi:glycosyltransferase involved in cell wall biosynthesis
MRRIRILYTIPNFDTAGTGNAMLKLATNLDKELFEPMIVCMHDRGKFFEQVRKSGIPYHIFPYLSELKPRIKLARNILRISSFFKKIRPDIVFSYNYIPNYSEAVAARLAGCKFAYIKKNMGWKGPSYNQWRINTALASAITVQNTDMMREFFPGNPKASIISLGVDTDEFMPRPAVLSLRKEFNIADTDKIVMCVANIIPKKGIDYLLKGFAVSESRKNAVLMIVGDDDHPLGRELHALKHALALGDRAIFTGKRLDIKDILTIADMFILPSTGNEGAPVAIQEAMASGILVVTTDTAGNRDQLRELPEQLIPVMDHLAIAKAIDKFLHISEADRNQILEKQHMIIADRYSLKLEVRKHEELYLKIMKKEML